MGKLRCSSFSDLMIKYLLFKLIHRLVLVFPKRWSYWIGSRVADLDYLLRKKLRRAVKSNLRQIFSTVKPEGISKSIISFNAKEVFRNFAKYLVDFFSFARLDSANINKIVKVKGLEYLRDAFSKGKGVICLTAHLGNWELYGVVTALLGFNVNVIALSHENTRINRLFTNQRMSKGVNVIPVGSGASQYLKVLRQNQLIGLLGDRLTSDTGIKVDFFNKSTVVPKGPAVLSLRTGAPIVPGFMVRTPSDTFNLVFEEPIDPAIFGKDNPMTIDAITHRIVSILEKYIKQYPSQWFLFYKVWDS